MVNKYKRKTSNASWDEAVMKLAMEEASKTSVKGAAKKYGINLSTLQRHIKKGCPKKKLGRYTTVFTDPQELELLEYVFHMEGLFFGLTKKEFLELVYQYAENNNIPHPFKNGMAGEDWYIGFKVRHPDLSLRRPEPTSLARARGFNNPQVQRFFDLLEGEIYKHKIDATRIYNVDETGIQTNSNKPPRVLSRSGKKQVGVISSVERGKLTTVVCCCNAAGAFIPPFLIFGRKRMVPRLLDGAPPGSVASCTDNGWINGPTFLDWLRHFVAMTRPTSEQKIILVMDNHVSHKYLEVLDYASKNNVIFVSFPPHTTHRLQPLDTCVYGPLKNYFEQAVSVFQRTHVGRIISQYDVARLFGEAYMKAASAHNAIKGFSSTGIWPTNRNVFDESDYMPSTLTDRPEPVTGNEESANIQPAVLNIEIPTNDNTDITETPTILSETAEVTAGQTEETASEMQSNNSPPLVADTDLELQVTEVNRPTTPEMQPSQPIKQHKTPIDIRPLPQITPNITTRKRKAQKAEILTSTPVKEELREKENKKKKSTNTKLKAVKKNLMEPSTNKKEVIACCSNTNQRQVRSKRGPKNSQNDKTEYACLVCAELYTEPPLEDWIRCDDCDMWAHEACTSYSGRGNYYCDACQE